MIEALLALETEPPPLSRIDDIDVSKAADFSRIISSRAVMAVYRWGKRPMWGWDTD